MEPVFVDMLPRIFNCYKEHGYKFIIAHYDFQCENEAKLHLVAPNDLKYYEKIYKIVRSFENFEDIPKSNYRRLIKVLVEPLKDLKYIREF